MKTLFILLCILFVGCSPAGISGTKEIPEETVDYSYGIVMYRKVVGNCTYVVAAYQFRGISIVHAGDCPNPTHNQIGDTIKIK